MRGVETSPGVYNGQNLWGSEIGKSQIVRRREGDDVAFAGDRLGL